MSRDITDHIAVLCNSSLAAPRANKLKPGSQPTYYAEFAYPPEAAGTLQALAATVAPGGNLDGMEVGVKLNSQKQKPVPGIPADWLVVKTATQFPPHLSDVRGVQVAQGTPEAAARISATFYAGRKVRAALSAFAWVHAQTGRRGVSFNLAGVMDAAQGGERLNIGSGTTANAFARYVQPGAQGAVGGQPAQQAANPFGGQASPAPAPTPAQQAANPFAQQPAQQAANPFAQQPAQQAVSPFAR